MIVASGSAHHTESAAQGPVRLEVAGLGYQTQDRSLLTDVSLRILPGELVGLVGPNGAGKTTLLRAISGLLAPSSGRVELEGRRLDKLDPGAIARIVAQVPQSTAIDFGFTCLEVVLMGRHPHLGRFAIEGPGDYRIAEAAMEITDTSELASRPMAVASGGERQRVLAARALAQAPRLLLLDEPTANLDVRHQLQLLDVVQQLVRGRNMSAIAAIHDLELAARYCDRLVLLKGGRVVAEGPPASVLTPERIQTAFGVRAVVRPDSITGALAITVISDRSPTVGRTGHVHVIGGGGSGSRLMHLLQVAGYRVTTGVLAENDTDYETTRLLGIEVVAVPPYTPVDAERQRRNADLAAAADCVVVAPVAIGHGNLANLDAAAGARRLVLVDAGSIHERDYTDGQATARYRELAQHALVADAPDVLAQVDRLLGAERLAVGQ